MRTTEPTAITQGERIEWTRSFSDFPATLYTLSYRFRGDGPGVDVAASPDGSDHLSVLTAAATLSMSAKPYQWQAWVTEIADATNTFIVDSGSLTVKAGFVDDDTGSVDLRSPAKITLDSIDAAMAAFATSDVQEYEITTPAGSRRVKRSARSEILSMRKYYATIVTNEIAREGARNGKPLMQSIHMRIHDV